MLPQKNRIRASVFPKLISNTRQLHGRLISLSYVRTPIQEPGIFAVVVSKAVTKHAVDRNRLRRQSYAAIKDIFNTLPMGYACVFFLKKGIQGISYGQLKVEMRNLLIKAQIIT